MARSLSWIDTSELDALLGDVGPKEQEGDSALNEFAKKLGAIGARTTSNRAGRPMRSGSAPAPVRPSTPPSPPADPGLPPQSAAPRSEMRSPIQAPPPPAPSRPVMQPPPAQSPPPYSARVPVSPAPPPVSSEPTSSRRYLSGESRPSSDVSTVPAGPAPGPAAEPSSPAAATTAGPAAASAAPTPSTVSTISSAPPFQPSADANLSERLMEYIQWGVDALHLDGLAVVDTEGLVVAQCKVDETDAVLATGVESFLDYIRDMFADDSGTGTMARGNMTSDSADHIVGYVALQYGERHLGAVWAKTDYGRFYGLLSARSAPAPDALVRIGEGLRSLFHD